MRNAVVARTGNFFVRVAINFAGLKRLDAVFFVFMRWISFRGYLCERNRRSRVTRREAGQVELLRRLTDLALVRLWQTATDSVKTIFPRATCLGKVAPIQFQRRGQLSIRAHNETFSVVATSLRNPDRPALRIQH